MDLAMLLYIVYCLPNYWLKKGNADFMFMDRFFKVKSALCTIGAIIWL